MKRACKVKGSRRWLAAFTAHLHRYPDSMHYDLRTFGRQDASFINCTSWYRTFLFLTFIPMLVRALRFLEQSLAHSLRKRTFPLSSGYLASFLPILESVKTIPH